MKSKKQIRNLYIILFISLIAIAGIVSLNYYLKYQQSQNQTEVEHLSWSKINPLTFLRNLKKHPEKPFTIYNPAPQDWIKEKHVNKLILMINSKEPASPVIASISSYYPFNQSSTVGNEAMFLIEGFKTGHYPPSLCSIYYFKGDPEVYKKWWEERKTK